MELVELLRLFLEKVKNNQPKVKNNQSKIKNNR